MFYEVWSISKLYLLFHIHPSSFNLKIRFSLDKWLWIMLFGKYLRMRYRPTRTCFLSRDKRRARELVALPRDVEWQWRAKPRCGSGPWIYPRCLDARDMRVYPASAIMPNNDIHCSKIKSTIEKERSWCVNMIKSCEDVASAIMPNNDIHCLKIKSIEKERSCV